MIRTSRTIFRHIWCIRWTFPVARCGELHSHRLGTPGTLAGEIYSGSSSVLNPGPYFTLIDDSDSLTRVVHFEDLFPTSDQTAFLDGHDVRFTLTLTPVPLPAAAWFFGSGVIGLAGLARRRMMRGMTP